MQVNLLLAQPETERKLAGFLRIALIALACWALAAIYGLCSTRAALAASHSAIATQNKKIAAIVQALPSREMEATKAARVKVSTSAGAASADVTGELSRVASVAGANIAGVRIGDGATAPVAAPSPSAAKSVSSSSSAAADAGSALNQETFECNVGGDYDALTRFLDLLAASPHVLDITTVQVTQAGGKRKTGGPLLEMKLNGIVYELPEKP